MHRISTKRLTACVVSFASSLALIGSSALYSAQEARRPGPPRAP